jgi:peptidoglycan hydrolase-like protein with peptidoglycan-binding domain
VPARTVQAALKEAGFYRGNIDGKVGPQTVRAITDFQRSQGITADGVVGRVTWQHLQAFVPAGMSTTRLK